MIVEDHYIYVKHSENYFVILSLYVYDILLAGNDLKHLKSIKAWLSFSFEMKDMGKSTYILCVKIHRDCLKNLLVLS